MDEKRIDILAEAERGWNLFLPNMQMLIIATIISTCVSFATIGVLAGPMGAGMLLIFRRLYRNDPVKPEPGDLFKGMEYFQQTLRVVVVYMVVNILTVFLLRRIPLVGSLAMYGFTLVSTVAYVWVMLFVVYQRMPAKEAALKLWGLVQSGRFLTPLLLALFTSFLSMAGSMACLVGTFFTTPLAGCILIGGYEELFGAVQEPAAPVETNAPPPSDLRL